MYRTQLVFGLTVTFAAMSVWFVVLALSFNLLILAPAVLFAVVAYFMWYHATGRLAERVYRRAERAGRGPSRASVAGRGGFGAGPRAEWERPGTGTRRRVRQERARRAGGGPGYRRDGGMAGGRQRGTPAGSDLGMGRQEAADVLGVDPSADVETVRTAYRDRIKEVHPDTDGGDEEAFKRVRDAYERLSA